MTPSSDSLQHAFLLDGHGGLTPFRPEDIQNWAPDQGPLWLHFDLTKDATQIWLTEKSELDPIAVEALLTVESRPRLTPMGKGALLAFRGINHNPGDTPDDMVGIRIWIDQDRIITSFRRNLRSVDDVAESLQASDGPISTGGIVTDLARRLVTRMSDTVDDFEERIGDLEEQVVEGTSRDTRFALATLRRQLIAIRRYLSPQREALSALLSPKIAWISEDDRISLRETNDRLMRHLEDLDAIRERAAVTQEELQSRLAEQQNIRMYVLSIVAAIFLPLGFLTGLLGINVGGIPGSENPAAFAIFAGLLIAIVAIELLFFRMRKWF